MRVDVQINTQAITRAFEALGKESRAAVGRALDRAITSTSVLAVKMTAAEINMRPAKIKKRLKVRRAFGTLSVAMTVTAKPSPLMDFVGTSFARKRRGGVSFRPLVGGGRTQLKHAFILQLKGGPRVFERARHAGGRFVGRYPLKALTGTFVSQFLGGSPLKYLADHAEKTFTSVLREELNFRLKRRTGAL